MELKNIQGIEDATRFGRREMFRIGSSLIFIVMIMLYASTIHVLDRPFSIELIIAAMIGGYMAMNIGANDVANNVGPAVGSKALTLFGAIIITGIFGIGFLREYLKSNYSKIIHDIEHHHTGKDHDVVQEFLHEFELASVEEKRLMLEKMKKHTAKADLTKKERKALGRVYRQELVKRSALKRIAAAWVITVPASGLMAAILFFTLRGMMLP